MTDDTTFDGTFPYSSRTFDSKTGAIRYVDEGPREGPPVVLVHGNPSWGYLYRSFIPALVREGYRVIVPDHLGFGRSEKPSSIEHLSVRGHADRFSELVDSLGLRGVSLVVHDWGGPIALLWATTHPKEVRRLVLFNTFVHRPKGRVAMPPPLRLFRLPGIGELFVKVFHAIVRLFLLGGGTRKHDRLTSSVRRAYLAPHPTYASRTSVLALARDYPDGPNGAVAELHGRIEAGLAAIDCPVWIAWGKHDDICGEEIRSSFERTFRHAEVTLFEDAGHFVQEDAHERIVPKLVRFFSDDQAAKKPTKSTVDLIGVPATSSE